MREQHREAGWKYEDEIYEDGRYEVMNEICASGKIVEYMELVNGQVKTCKGLVPLRQWHTEGLFNGLYGIYRKVGEVNEAVQ